MSSPDMSADYESFDAGRPGFVIGNHESGRWDALTDNHHSHVLASGVSEFLVPKFCQALYFIFSSRS